MSEAHFLRKLFRSAYSNPFTYQTPPTEQYSSGLGSLYVLYTMSVDKLYRNMVQLWTYNVNWQTNSGWKSEETQTFITELSNIFVVT